MGLITWIVPLLIIGGIIYLLVRSRRNGQNGFTAYEALVSYFYFVTAASVILMVVGLIFIFKVAFSQAFEGGEIASDLTSGLVLLSTGLVICILHIFGRRAIQREDEKSTIGIRRAYVFSMLVIFSIAGLVSLPLALTTAIRYFIEENSYYNRPSGELAAALVFVPMWAYYLYRVLREVRIKTEG